MSLIGEKEEEGYRNRPTWIRGHEEFSRLVAPFAVICIHCVVPT